MNRTLRTPVPHRAAYRLLESEFELRSDSPDLLERFDRLYHRFRVPGTPTGAPMSV